MCDFIAEIRPLGTLGSLLTFGAATIRMYLVYRTKQEEEHNRRLLEEQRQDAAIILTILQRPAILESDGSVNTYIRTLPLTEPMNGLRAQVAAQLRNHDETDLQRHGP